VKSIIHVNCSQSLALQPFFLPPSISCSCSLAGGQVQYRIQSSPVMAWNPRSDPPAQRGPNCEYMDSHHEPVLWRSHSPNCSATFRRK
jgi:hypothetical protein